MENQEQKNDNLKIFFSPKRKRMISPRNEDDSNMNENITTIVTKHREILSECPTTTNKIIDEYTAKASYSGKNISPINNNKLLLDSSLLNKSNDIIQFSNRENLEEMKFDYRLNNLRGRIFDCNDSFSNNSSSEIEEEDFTRLYKLSALKHDLGGKDIKLKGSKFFDNQRELSSSYAIHSSSPLAADEDCDYIGRMSGLTVGKHHLPPPGISQSPLSSPIMVNGIINSNNSTPHRISDSIYKKDDYMKTQNNIHPKIEQLPQKTRPLSNIGQLNDSSTFIRSFNSAVSNDNITQANHSLTDDMFYNDSNSSISFGGGMNMMHSYHSNENIANSSDHRDISNISSNNKKSNYYESSNQNESNEGGGSYRTIFTNVGSNMLPPRTPLILNKTQGRPHEVVMGDLGTPVTEAGSPAVLHPLGEEDEIVFEEDEEVELDDEEMVMIHQSNNNGGSGNSYGAIVYTTDEPELFEDHNYHLFAQQFVDSPSLDSKTNTLTCAAIESPLFHAQNNHINKNVLRKIHFDRPDNISYLSTSNLSVSDHYGVNIGTDIAVMTTFSRESSSSMCNKSIINSSCSGMIPSSDGSMINTSRPLPDQSAFEGSSNNPNDLSSRHIISSYDCSMQDAILASVGSTRKKRLPPASSLLHNNAALPSAIGINFSSNTNNKDCPPTPLRNFNWTVNSGSAYDTSPFSVDLIADPSAHDDYSTSSSSENCSKIFSMSLQNSGGDKNNHITHNLGCADSNMKSSTIGLHLQKSTGLTRQNSLLENKVLLCQNELESLEHNSICYHKDFENLGLLGTGTFAEVFKVKRKTGDDRITIYAIKKSKRQFRSKRDREWLMSEVFTMKLICDQYCAYVVPFIRAWQEDSYFYVQMGYAERGTLKEFLVYLGSKKSKLLRGNSSNTDTDNNVGSQSNTYAVPDHTIWRVLHDVSSGLHHIHNCGIVHLDIKPANLLITDSGCIQIGDFGMSAQIGSKEDGHEGDTR